MTGSEELKPQKSVAPFLPKLSKICAPSRKNGRFSGKKVSNALRLMTAGSTSPCPKSGWAVAPRRALGPAGGGVEGRVERQVAGDAVFRIEPRRRERTRAVVERIGAIRRG